MRIAVYHNQPSGGARRALYEFCKQLSKRHTIDVFTLSGPGEAFLSSRDFAAEINTFPFHPRRSIRAGLYLNDVRRIQDLADLERISSEVADRIDSGNYDVAFVDACRFTHTPSVLAGLQTPSAYYCHHPPRRFLEEVCRPEATSLSLYARARLIWHKPAAAIYDRMIAGRDQRNLASAGRVLTNSEYTRSIIRGYYGTDASVCHPGVDCDHFQPKDGERGDYVLGVGALEPHKGYDFLIRSIARIPSPLRPRLVIVGNTDDSGIGGRLLRLAEQTGVTLDVLTDVDARGEHLVDLYQRARALVFTAYAEPFGLVLLEAMACGIPVLSVDEGGPREIVVNGETGFLVPRDEARFAETLTLLLEDKSLARHLGERAREVAVERWTWEAASEQLERELSSLVGADVGVAR